MVDLCEVCQISEFKYKCPGCFKKTCSLPCTKKHKNDDDCSGKAHEPTKYIDSDSLKSADDERHENNALIQRDYYFLNRVKRSLEVEMRDSRLNNKRILQLHGNNSGVKRPRYDQECQRIIRRGVNCILLPRGMQRSQMNKSKWDKPLDLFVWSIEWIISPRKQPNVSQELFKHISHRIKETDTLVEGMGKIIYDKCCEFYRLTAENESVPETKPERTQQLIQGGLKFYAKWFPYNTVRVMDSKQLVELDPCHKSIAELFKNRTVIEFPTIYVAASESELPEGYIVVDEQAIKDQKNVTKSSSDSESDSDGDESDESENDSDSQPQEESSKKQDSNKAQQDSDDDSDGYDPGVTLDFLVG